MAFQLRFIVLASAAIAVAFSQEETQQDTSCVASYIPRNTPPRCGEAVQTRNGTSGVIYYKPYEQVVDNERCVWTVPDANEMHVLYLGYPASDPIDPSTGEPTQDPQLLFSVIRPDSSENIYDNYVATAPGVYSFSTGSVVIVTFSSGTGQAEKNNKGFIIQYRTSSEYTDGTKKINAMPMPPAKILYSDPEANGYEIATYVFPPENNYYPGTPYPVHYVDTDDVQHCSYFTDFMVYRFDRKLNSEPWQRVDKFCYGAESVALPGYNDIQMVVMKSRSYTPESRKFALYQTRCRY